MKKERLNRYALRKGKWGLVSVAVASLVFLGGPSVSAQETTDANVNTETVSSIDKANDSSETSISSGDKAAASSENTDKKQEESHVEMTKPASNSNSDQTNASSDSANHDSTAANSAESANSTSLSLSSLKADSANASLLATSLAATTDATGTESAAETFQTSPVPTPTTLVDGQSQAVKNVQYDQYKDLYKNGDLAGTYGLYLVGKDKEGKEVATTAFGANIVNTDLIDLTDLNLRFVFKNGDTDTNTLFDVLLPNYDAQKNGNLVFDADRVTDKTKDLTVNSQLGNDYSKGMSYSNIGHAGDYKGLSDYISQQGGFSENLYGVYFRANVKANDLVWFDLPVKLLNPDDSKPVRQASSVWDFRNWNRTYLNTYIAKGEIPARLVADKPILATGAVIQGENWQYAKDLMDKVGDQLPTSDKIYRFATSVRSVTDVTLEKGVDATFVKDEQGGHYILKSLNPVLGKYNILPSNYFALLLTGSDSGDEAEKKATDIQTLIAQHGYTFNKFGIQYGRYLYDYSGGAKLDGIPANEQPAEGVAPLYLQVIPALLLNDFKYKVDATSTDWTIVDLLKQFSDPHDDGTLVPIDKDAKGSWINDAAKVAGLKVSIENVATGEKVSDLSKLKQQVGRYKVTASYDYGTEAQPWVISNTAFVDVYSDYQEIKLVLQDANDASNPVTLTTETVSGKSGEAVDQTDLQDRINALVAQYQVAGYEVESSTALPTNFDDTENAQENVDSQPQVVTISLKHQIEEVTETKDANLTVSFTGAGDLTPAAISQSHKDAFSRTKKVDMVTKETLSTADWTPSDLSFDSIDVPVLAGYTPERSQVSAVKASPDQADVQVVVAYHKDPVITTEEVKEKTVLAHGSREVEDPSLPEGTRVVSVTGVDGYKELVYTVTYTDGVETSRVLTATNEVAPVEEVILVGTKKAEQPVEPEIQPVQPEIQPVQPVQPEKTPEGTPTPAPAVTEEKPAPAKAEKELPATGSQDAGLSALVGVSALIAAGALSFRRNRRKN